MFYDAIGHSLVMFGGQAGDLAANDETWLLRWESPTREEACDGTDADGDGRVGCDDEDCAARCQPRCVRGAPCDLNAPHCGDGVCNPFLEDHALCPGDC